MSIYVKENAPMKTVGRFHRGDVGGYETFAGIWTLTSSPRK